MSLVTTFQVGGLTCHALEGGRQRLDGGAMFGVVPKPLWSRRIAADDRNRIPLALRCLLVEHDDGPVLIDTGIGNKESEKFRDIYGVENAGTAGPTQLDDALAEIGLVAADVRYVVNTHLHFDHAGGNTFLPGDDSSPEADGRVAFPNATYIVQAADLEFGMQGNERIAASYLSKNFAPVAAAGLWRLLHGDEEIVPGVQAVLTPGTRAPSPVRLDLRRRRNCVLSGGPGAHRCAPAVAVDHGVRPGAVGDVGEQETASHASRDRGVDPGIRARSGARAGAGGQGR